MSVEFRSIEASPESVASVKPVRWDPHLAAFVDRGVFLVSVSGGLPTAVFAQVEEKLQLQSSIRVISLVILILLSTKS